MQYIFNKDTTNSEFVFNHALTKNNSREIAIDCTKSVSMFKLENSKPPSFTLLDLKNISLCFSFSGKYKSGSFGNLTLKHPIMLAIDDFILYVNHCLDLCGIFTDVTIDTLANTTQVTANLNMKDTFGSNVVVKNNVGLLVNDDLSHLNRMRCYVQGMLHLKNDFK